MNTTVMKLLVGLVFLVSCKKFEFDPNQSSTVSSEKDLNQTNIRKLQSAEGDSTIVIALIGDSHVYYESLGEAVDAINRIPEVDFVIHAGDISDHGFVVEFEKGVDYMKDLSKPFVTVVGNHDVLANGRYAYLEMFGPTNFSFVYQNVRFVFFDSNSREYGFPGNVPDLAWISSEIKSGAEGEKIVLVSHVPFFNSDYDGVLIEPYKELLHKDYETREILYSLSGHQHGYYDVQEETNEIPHLGSGSTKERNFYLITIGKEGTSYERRTY